jgi:dTDP-glucose 4,6-dehydratase
MRWVPGDPEERMNWKGRKVLVTGAGGFIGSHLVEELLALDAEVTAFVRYNSQGSTGFLASLGKGVRIAAGDLEEYQSVRDAVDGQEYVFHLGAIGGVPYSYIHPREVVSTNVMGTLNVLTAAKEMRPNLVILTSTSEVYGTARYIPIDENHPFQAQSPYAASKIAADKLGEAFHRAYGLPVATVRPFNTFGPRQSTRAVIPTIITQALRGRTLRLGAVTPTRDFLFVKDTVRAFLATAASPKAPGETFNFGSGQEISIRELVTKVASLLGKEIEILTDEIRLRPEASEVQRLCADIRKAQTLLDWQPRYSLEEGLRETCTWIESSLDCYPQGYHI